ncbi:hypothetical protein GCM10020001_093050 [Nonomuraea salmonea]
MKLTVKLTVELTVKQTVPRRCRPRPPQAVSTSTSTPKTADEPVHLRMAASSRQTMSKLT